MTTCNDRITYFDGLRGIAALVVLNEHFLKVFAPSAYRDESQWPLSSSLIDWLTFPPFNLFLNGAPAVMLFFVISGWVLARYIAAEPSVNLLSETVKRYARLMLPCLASLLLLYFITLVSDFGATSVISESGSNERAFLSFGANLIDVIKQGAVGVLIFENHDLNPALWTLSSELYGSIFIFIMFWVFQQCAKARTDISAQQMQYLKLLVFGALAFSFSYLVTLSYSLQMDLYLTYGMLLGMFLNELTNNGSVSDFLKRHIKYWGIPTLCASFILLGYSTRGYHQNPYFQISLWELGMIHEYLYNAVGGGLLLLCIYYMPKIQSFLSSPIMIWLGKRSFSLYLTHYLVLMTVGTLLGSYSYFFNSSINLAVTGFVTIIGVFGLAELFNKAVDMHSIKLSRVLKQRILMLPKFKDFMQLRGRLASKRL